MNYNQGYNMQSNVNPYASPQQAQMQRLQQYEQMQQMQQQYNQNYNQQMQQQLPQQSQMQGVRPVTSIEEVRGITPDFSGAKMYFEDVTNNKFYVKYMDLNGLPITKVFSIDNTPSKPTEVTNVDYVSKEEFNSLKAKMEQYENIIKQFIGEGGNGDAK